MKNIFTTLDTVQPATASLVARTFANSATCALIGMVGNAVAREQRLAQRGGIDAYNELTDQAQDDNDSSAMIGTVPKLTLNQLVEFAAAARAYASTVASGLDGNERRFAEPQDIAGSFEFMAKPRTSVSEVTIAALIEEEPDLSREQCITALQALAIDDATRLNSNKAVIIAQVNDLLDQATHDRELTTIWDELPENYRNGLLEKANGAILRELDRTLPLLIRGVPGISAKRKVLKGDLPALEAVAA